MLGKICPQYPVIPSRVAGIEMCGPPYIKGLGFHDPPILRGTPLIPTLNN